MKTFAWLLTLAFAVICVSCWRVSQVSLAILAHLNVHLPTFTLAVLHPCGWILFCPLPWVVYSAVLSLRKEVKPGSTFLFAGTLFFALALVVCAVVIANAMAWLSEIWQHIK
jgi:hypothetical protein